MLCQYKDIFGKVGEGVHSYRLFNIAVADVLLTIALAYVVYMFMPGYSFLYILIGLFLLGIVAHRVFCVRTTVDKLLF
jgi:uncharacterized membrane protein